MGYEFEIAVWKQGDNGLYGYRIVYEASNGEEEAMRKLKEVKKEYPDNAVKFTWR
jgi:hypothetical protein